MMHILKCPGCGSYGLEERCSCGSSRVRPKPPKYSPEDKYGEYRRKYKEQQTNGADNDDLEDQGDQGS